MLIVGGIAYVVFGGHVGDCDVYHGWVIGVPLSGKGARAWATQVGGRGIWAPGGPASDGQSIYVTTGNGKHGARHLGRERGALPASTPARASRDSRRTTSPRTTGRTSTAGPRI